jgi:hypothetical protein
MGPDSFVLMTTSGDGYFEQKKKLLKVKAALKPRLPDGARLVIRENDHDFGPYPSLDVVFDSELDEDELRRIYALEEVVFDVADEVGVDY